MECPSFNPEGFQQLWEMVQTLQRRLDQDGKDPVIVKHPVRQPEKGELCHALVWNGGKGARCSKAASGDIYCKAHSQAIHSGVHKHGTLENPCCRFEGIDFSKNVKIEKSAKGDKPAKSKPVKKKEEAVKTKKALAKKGSEIIQSQDSSQTREQIKKKVSSLLRGIDSIEKLEDITAQVVIQSLGWERLNPGVKDILNSILREQKTHKSEVITKTAKTVAPKIDDAMVEEAEDQVDEEVECDEQMIEGVMYLVANNGNVYQSDGDNDYIGRFIDGALQKGLPEL